MNRLTTLGIVTTFDRRIGGARAGSQGLVYTLDVRGRRLLSANGTGRIRRHWAIGAGFVAHTLDVAELFVRLRAQQGGGVLTLTEFAAEPNSWHQTATGTLKPDAYAVWRANGWELHRWFEVDRATESTPTLRRKFLRYLDALAAGDEGPHGVMPSVVITVPTAVRAAAVHTAISALPPIAQDYFSVELFIEYAVELTTLSVRPPP